MAHGGDGGVLSVKTATISIRVLPSAAIAVVTAFRSAHIVAPYDEFSTLQPVYIFPEDVTTAAPTLNPEYGAYALILAFRASLRACFTRRTEIDDATYKTKILFPSSW